MVRRSLTTGVLISLSGFWVAAAAASACDGGLKPMQSAWVWTYRTTDKSGVSTYEMRRSLGEGNYTDTYLTPGQPPATQTYRCNAGAHVNITPPNIAGAHINKLTVSGVSFPAAADWKPGYAWVYSMTMEGRKSGLAGQATMTLNYRVLGRETVTVPAGTFDAWKVEMRGHVNARIAIVPIEQNFHETQWVTDGVGVVKIQRESGVSELTSLKK